MICQKLRQLCELTTKYNPLVNRAELVRLACQACQRLDVCPALSGDEFDSRLGLHQLQPAVRRDS